MKTYIWLLMVVTFLSSSSAVAQNQRLSSEERTKMAMDALVSFDLTKEKKSATEIVIADFYSNGQKALREMRALNDREGIMEKRKQLAAERDDKLKIIFTEDQFKKWINEIEPSLRPKRMNTEAQGAN